MKTTEFINIETKIIKDLYSVKQVNYPDNWNPETIKRMIDLKASLIKFWGDNKYLIEE